MVSRTGADVSVKQQLEIIWRRFDVDGNGIISWKEFASGMKSMGLDYSSDELSQIMKEFDTNCDGALDWLEFVGHPHAQGRRRCLGRVRAPHDDEKDNVEKHGREPSGCRHAGRAIVKENDANDTRG